MADDTKIDVDPTEVDTTKVQERRPRRKPRSGQVDAIPQGTDADIPDPGPLPAWLTQKPAVVSDEQRLEWANAGAARIHSGPTMSTVATPPMRYRRRGTVTAIVYNGMNRDVLEQHAGAYLVDQDDAFCVTVDGKETRLFPGDAVVLRLGSKEPDEKTERVIAAAVWADEYELA